MSTEKAYPLCWPVGWPRTAIPSSSAFAERSVDAALKELVRQLNLLKATDMVVSSNVSLGRSTPKDKGVCVYFILNKKPYALPCDKWSTVQDNVWALAQHIDSLRGQQRWGVGTIERQFAGYVALPAPAGTNPEEWWSVLKCDRASSPDQVAAAYKERAMMCHPDRGGSAEAMALVNAAYAIYKKSRP